MAKSFFRIPRILVQPTLRLVCLRLVLLTAAALFILFVVIMSLDCKSVSGCKTPLLFTVIFGITLAHHLASAFGPKLIPLLTWIDLLLTAGELGFCIWLSALLLHQADFQEILNAVSLNHLILTLFLGCLFILNLIKLVDARGRTLAHRVDVLASSQNALAAKNIPPWKYFLRVTVGTWLWKKIIP
ncbi:hypothetical protein MD484_g5428, partial [Candolleomyces efflorescens]